MRGFWTHYDVCNKLYVQTFFHLDSVFVKFDTTDLNVKFLSWFPNIMLSSLTYALHFISVV